jgi:cyclopropane-fatty-acyl-phospholipid synthase
MRNYDALFAGIARWLAPQGRLFVHIFCHRSLMYPFEAAGEDNWMGRHFFTGGLMPSADTLLQAQSRLPLQERWLLPGSHYRRTAEHWLQRQDRNREEVMAVLREAYGAEAPRWHQRWRMFWMACAEMFGYAGGSEWLVGHYRFGRD